MLAAAGLDLTLFFRGLSRLPAAADADDQALLAPLHAAFYAEPPAEGVGRELLAWLRRYQARAALEPLDEAERRRRMDLANPLYVPRNWLAQQAIDAATEGDLSVLERLLEVLRRPFTERPGLEAYAARRPDWARDRPGCSALSCSS